MHSRRASVMGAVQGIERMKRLSVAEKKEQYNEQRAQEEQVESDKLKENWVRVFNGAERQMQYAQSLSTATQLPEIGRWQEIGHGILGNLANLRIEFHRVKSSMESQVV